MAEEQRRRSFDEVLNDALVQWTKKFERALEQQRQVIEREANERTADIEGATLEHLGVLEQTVAARSAELEQAAREHRDAFEDAMRGRDKELDAVAASQAEAIGKVANDALRELEEKATSEVRRIEEETTVARDDVRRFVADGSTAFDEFAQKRLDELEDTLRAKLEGFRRELIDETHRVRDASEEQLNETRVLVTSETRRIEEQAAASQDEMRRVTAEETGTFDRLARERIVELQDALRSQTELLDDFTRMHGSTSTQLDEVRTFTKETMERLSKLDSEVKRQVQVNEESVAAAAERLKHASATELNSIQQRAMAIDELARKHIAEVERSAERLLGAETSTAEGLRDFERQMEGRRAEIERVLDDRVAALRQQVQEADAAVVRRMTELGQRAESNAQALETRLAQAADERTNELDKRLAQAADERTNELDKRLAQGADERSKELEAFAEEVIQALDSRLAQATKEASAASTTDGRMKQLIEMLAAAQVGLDQVVDRVETLEAIAVAGADNPEEAYNGREERYEEVDAAPPENGASQAPDGDGAAPRVPTRAAPSTPDLRWDQ
jgi:hypothetical protein